MGDTGQKGQPMRIVLHVGNRHQQGKAIKVRGPDFFIGRHPDCGLRIGNPKVSVHHCVLLVRADGVRVRDLASTNGTYVNGRPALGDQLLATGDKLRIGPFIATVEIQERDAVSERELAALLLAGSEDPAAGVLGLDDPGLPATETDLPVTAPPPKPASGSPDRPRPPS
ncbi:MAG: FHA domain-containing protein [Gemmataceae bacterium]|nr:FHA domain-containing protein [Gemmataceae bacterium]